jgi:choline dehydrogenase
MSTALTYVNPNRHRLNLTIRGNVLVRRILFEGAKAVGVEVESGGEIFTVEAEQIVLCAGAVASPHLLMLSGVGPAEHLSSFGIPVVKDLPGVGQNLRDHPLVPIRARVKDDFLLDPRGRGCRACCVIPPRGLSTVTTFRFSLPLSRLRWGATPSIPRVYG